MKNLFTGIIILSMLSLFSCTRVVYTQQQVLSKYQTKEDVMKNLGIPTEKKSRDSTEAWLYRYWARNMFSNHSGQAFHNTQTVTVTDFSHYNRYLVFVFDQKGNVIANKSYGVNLAKKKKNVIGTLALVATAIGLFLGICVMAYAYSSS